MVSALDAVNYCHMQNMPTKLNLGCGEDKKEGFLNVDWTVLVKPDLVCDLNTLPYPFPDNTFEYIEASHVLEHLERPFAIMKELHRILVPQGVLNVKVPHFSRGMTHPEHSHGFDVTLPKYFDRTCLRWGYFGVDFKVRKVELHWMAFQHLLPYMGYGRVTLWLLSIINRIINFVAKISPAFASRIWCFWVGGFEEIEFEFEAIKE